MKKLILPLSLLALGLTSCVESKTEIFELLQNNDTRKEVLKTITNSYDYMEDLNQEMINSGSAIQIFEANPDMVNHLINNDGMVDL